MKTSTPFLGGNCEGRQRLRRRPSERGHHSTPKAIVDRVHVAGEVQATDRVRILVVVLREKKKKKGLVALFFRFRCRTSTRLRSPRQRHQQSTRVTRPNPPRR